MKLSNLRLLVKDYDKCIEFYTEKLGFEKNAEYSSDYYTSINVGGGINDLGIFRSADMESQLGYTRKVAPHGCEKICLSFEVDDVEEVYRTLKSRGAEFMNEPREWDGAMVLHLRDPEDNVIEFYAYIKEAAK